MRLCTCCMTILAEAEDWTPVDSCPQRFSTPWIGTNPGSSRQPRTTVTKARSHKESPSSCRSFDFISTWHVFVLPEHISRSLPPHFARSFGAVELSEQRRARSDFSKILWPLQHHWSGVVGGITVVVAAMAILSTSLRAHADGDGQILLPSVDGHAHAFWKLDVDARALLPVLHHGGFWVVLCRDQPFATVPLVEGRREILQNILPVVHDGLVQNPDFQRVPKHERSTNRDLNKIGDVWVSLVVLIAALDGNGVTLHHPEGSCLADSHLVGLPTSGAEEHLLQRVLFMALHLLVEGHNVRVAPDHAGGAASRRHGCGKLHVEQIISALLACIHLELNHHLRCTSQEVNLFVLLGGVLNVFLASRIVTSTANLFSKEIHLTLFVHGINSGVVCQVESRDTVSVIVDINLFFTIECSSLVKVPVLKTEHRSGRHLGGASEDQREDHLHLCTVLDVDHSEAWIALVAFVIERCVLGLVHHDEIDRPAQVARCDAVVADLMVRTKVWTHTTQIRSHLGFADRENLPIVEVRQLWQRLILPEIRDRVPLGFNDQLLVVALQPL